MIDDFLKSLRDVLFYLDEFDAVWKSSNMKAIFPGVAKNRIEELEKSISSLSKHDEIKETFSDWMGIGVWNVSDFLTFLLTSRLTIYLADQVEEGDTEAIKQADKGSAKPETIECTIEYTTGKKTFSCNSREVEYAIKDVRRQIVDRDFKLIDSSDYVFVYHPRESISAGVMCEMMHAKIEGKMVYAMYPFEPSPFFEHYANRIFKNKEEFLEFVKGLS